MPNRIIKESICVSEQIDELSAFEEVFFYRLLVNCDDYGCMDAREKVLSAKLFPLRAIRANEIMKTVNRLAEIGLIALYDVDDHPYLKVLKWADHQRVRISKHKYPEPTEEQIAASCGNSRQVAANCGELRQDAASCGLNPIQSNPNTNLNPNPNPTRTREEKSPDDSLFALFWNAYPRKEGKENARKAFSKLNVDGGLMDILLKAIEKQKGSAQWQESGGQFIPYPATWLNGKRWEDEVKPASAVEKKPVKKAPAQQYEQREYVDEDNAAYKRMIAEWRGG